MDPYEPPDPNLNTANHRAKRGRPILEDEESDENDPFVSVEEDEQPEVGLVDARAHPGDQQEADEEDDRAAAEQVEQTTINESEAARPLHDWQHGVGIHPVPPKFTLNAVSGPWAFWGPQMERPGARWRAVRHECFNFPLDLCENDGTLTGYKTFVDPKDNARSMAQARLFGLFDIEAKGFFVDGMGLVEEEQLEGMELSARAKKVKSMRVSKYTWNYKYKTQIDAAGKAVSNAPHYQPGERLPTGSGRTGTFAYESYCVAKCVELLYGKPTAEQLAVDPGARRGTVIGKRLHVLTFNPAFSRTALWNEVLTESDDMRHAQSVTGAPNAARGQGAAGPQNAAKLQRAMAADPDVNKYGCVKFIEINNVGVLCDNIHCAAGQDSGDGSCIRTPLGTMAELQTSMGTQINEKKFKRDQVRGGQHALCPESLYNIRRNADPPRGIFPDVRTHPDCERNGARPYNPAMESFMVSVAGLPLDVCDDQVNPNNYFDSEGFTRFPFPKAVAFLARATENFQMSAMPLPLPNSVIIGDAALREFHVYQKSKGSARIAAIEADALNEVASEVLESNADVLSMEDAIARVTAAGRPTFEDIRDRLRFFFDQQMRHDQEGVGVRRAKMQQLLQADSLDRGPNELSGRMSGKRDSGVADQRITLATEKLIPFSNAAYAFCVSARDWKLAQPDAVKTSIQNAFSDAVTDVMLWTVELFIKTYSDAETEHALAPKAVEIWNSFAKLRRRLPEYATHATVNPKDPRRNEGSLNYAFMFRNTRQKSGVSVWGEWSAKLATIYSNHIDIHGVVLADRLAIHLAAYQPACYMAGFQINPMMFIDGPKGVGKSARIDRMSFLFNAQYDPKLERSWFQRSGDMSKTALAAGGISNFAGGVQTCDEAIPYLVTGSGVAQNQDTRKEQMNVLKELLTTCQSVRTRTVQKQSGGAAEWCARADSSFNNAATVGALNLGPQHIRVSGKQQVPSSIDPDTAAVLDRIQCYACTDKSPRDCMSTGEIYERMKTPPYVYDCLAHTLVVTISSMLIEIVSHVPWLRAANFDDAEDTWREMDTHLEDAYDIPPPDPRRRAWRSMVGIMLSVERAVVTYTQYMEEAVAFPAMQPCSQALNVDDDPATKKPVLSPYTNMQLVDILKLVFFDAELIMSVYTTGLNARLSTNPEMFHALLVIAEKHGAQSVLNEERMYSAPSQPRCPRTVIPPAVPAVATSGAGPSGAASATAAADMSDDEDEDMADGRPPDEQPAPPLDEQPAPPQAVVNDVDDLPKINFGNAPRADNMNLHDELVASAGYYERRRIVLQTFRRNQSQISSELLRRRQSDVAAARQKSGKAVEFNDARFEATLSMSKTKGDDSKIGLVDGTIIPMSEALDLLLPTSADVLACGYAKNDLQQWLIGCVSSSKFTINDIDKAFLGVLANGWYFRRRVDRDRPVEQYDTSWRTMSLAHASTPATASDPAADPAGPAAVVATASSSSALQNAPNGRRDLWNLAGVIAKELSRFNLEQIHIFDRIDMLMAQPDDQQPLVQIVSGDPRDITNVSALLDDLNSASMCKLKEGTTASAVVGKSMDAVQKFTEPITKRGSAAVHPIPLAAVSLRGAHRSPELLEKTMRVARTRDASVLPTLTDVEDATLYQQRQLDRLVAANAFPAVVPLVSPPQRRCPIMIDNHDLLVSSSFIVDISKRCVELLRHVVTIPGMRPQLKEADLVVAQVAASPTDAQTERAGNAGRAEVVRSAEEAAAHTQRSRDARLGTKQGDIAQTIARRMLSEGRTTPSSEDIHEFMRKLPCDIRERAAQKFDVFHIFLAHRMSQLFNDDHPFWFETLISRFPGIFPSRNAILDVLPETTLRFFPSEYATFMRNARLVSAAKLTDPVLANQGASKRACVQRRPPTHHELIDTRQAHKEATGEDISDIERLKELAATRITGSSKSTGALTQRSVFCDRLRAKRLDRGVARRGGVFDRAALDVGLGMLAHTRGIVAQSTNEPCSVSWLAKEAAHLRPYRPPPHKGTCLETDRMLAHSMISSAVVSQTGPVDRQDDEGLGEEHTEAVWDAMAD